MKIQFTKKQIKFIISLYVDKNLNTTKIGDIFGISKIPINRILKENNVLRSGTSNGIKINISDEQSNKIKEMYLNHASVGEISREMELTESFIDKYLSKSGYRRDKSKAMSILKKGVKLSDKVKNNMKIAQQKLAKSGKRKQTGGVCKSYTINGLKCQGTYEKYYLEKLIQNGDSLPFNPKSIITPFGVYYPDFSFNDRLIEIKSDYTYDVLLGNKISRFTNKFETKQYQKIKWVNENIKPVDILVVDKRNNKINKKQI